jgi:hypothetical protein
MAAALNARPTANAERPENSASALDELDFFRSVAGNIKGFLYRCAADENYTMLNMTIGFVALTGFPLSDMLNNAVRTFAWKWMLPWRAHSISATTGRSATVSSVRMGAGRG